MEVMGRCEVLGWAAMGAVAEVSSGERLRREQRGLGLLSGENGRGWATYIGRGVLGRGVDRGSRSRDLRDSGGS